VLPPTLGLLDCSLVMEAARTSKTSVDNHFTRQYIPEDNSELHTRRREILKFYVLLFFICGAKSIREIAYIYNLLIKPEGKRHFLTHSATKENNIKIDLEKVKRKFVG
jgi:hypothetical protein